MTPPEQQLARLRALWELGLDRQTPATQLEGLLQEACGALECEYAELWNERTQQRIAQAGERAVHPLGSLAFTARVACDEQAVFVLDPAERTDAREALRRAGKSAVLLRRFEAAHEDLAIAFAWNHRRQRSISDAQAQYVDFFTHVVSRILVLADKHRELHDRVSIDPLTGLQNRSATLERIAHLVSSASRAQTAFAVLYLDLNGFKQVNDSHGHALGDRAIAEAARRMRAVVRRHEVAGRIGGDEFAVLVHFDDAVELEAVAQRLLDAISEPMTFSDVHLCVSASVGIAMFPQHGGSADELLARADTAMYAAKRGNGSQYAFYDGTSPARLPRTVAATSPLPFVFCFQPIIDARTARVVSAEALIRWFHPTRGLVLPGTLDESGAMPKHIDRAVIDAFAGTDEYRQMARFLPVHVNVSEADDEVLARFPAEGAHIALEIAEPLIAREPDRYSRFISAATERGLRVGVADFGGAGLPLRFLADLRIDFVKIGRSFENAQHGMSAAAVRAAIAQAHHFGWSVIAENVEDQAQREWLVNAGADNLQGFHICGPLTHRDFANWMSRRGVK